MQLVSGNYTSRSIFSLQLTHNNYIMHHSRWETHFTVQYSYSRYTLVGSIYPTWKLHNFYTIWCFPGEWV